MAAQLQLNKEKVGNGISVKAWGGKVLEWITVIPLVFRVYNMPTIKQFGFGFKKVSTHLCEGWREMSDATRFLSYARRGIRTDLLSHL